MPFRKIGRDRYRSPSGRILTGRQVRAYYARQHGRGQRRRRRGR